MPWPLARGTQSPTKTHRQNSYYQLRMTRTKIDCLTHIFQQVGNGFSPIKLSLVTG
jgi:hypothetical protein